ncbi:MAG: hypothetical protein JWM68_1662 [Verrucomicrobiales bacterium]|nr:hypothetical protein [Verrucomicrobiales bacterium]
MRVAFSLFVLLASFVLGSAQTPRTLEKINVSGTECVRLLEWCDANGLKLLWTKKDEDLRATNRFHKLYFSVDSRKTEIDGVIVLLSSPIFTRNGVPLVSTIDLQTAIHPLVYPQQLPKNRIQTICIDAGHGGKDTGKIDPNGRDKKFEKTYTLLLADEVADILEKQKFKVVMVRSRDKTVDLSERAEVANRAKADLFVCLHFNSAGDRGVRGLETFCMSPAGMESSNAGGGRANVGTYDGNVKNSENMVLAYQVQKSILKNVGMEDRGVKRARFEVLRDAKMPAILVEGGFMSNPSEAKKIYDPAWRKRMAQAVVDGILAYKKMVHPEDQLVAQKPIPAEKDAKKKTARD